MSENTPPVPAPELLHPVEVFVVRPQKKRYWLHVLLLLLTICTTIIVGSHLQYTFNHDLPVLSETDDSEIVPLFPVERLWHHPDQIALGIPFSLALLSILLAHEMGHYVLCQKYGVQATLPYFIPAPTLIGTLGAFIRIKSRIPSRAALFDIGIAGPIAGFVVAFPVLLFSLPLSKPSGPVSPDDVQFGMPLIFHLTHLILSPAASSLHAPLSQLRLHPVAMAAWVGMFATSLNLLPGGQLDGGHIVYAVEPYRHKLISRAVVVVLIPLAIFFWSGWLLWAVLLIATGMRHPAVPIWPELDLGRRKLALLALVLLILTITPAPVDKSLLDYFPSLHW